MNHVGNPYSIGLMIYLYRYRGNVKNNTVLSLLLDIVKRRPSIPFNDAYFKTEILDGCLYVHLSRRPAWSYERLYREYRYPILRE